MATKAKTSTAKKTTKAKAMKAAVRVSIESDAVETAGRLPGGTVKLGPGNGLKINVQKLQRTLMRDQRARMVDGMGCVSNPGGPGC